MNASLVTIMQTEYHHQIEIARSILSTNGIKTFIFDEKVNSIYGGALGGYKLKVNENDVERAQQILKESQDENNLYVV